MRGRPVHSGTRTTSPVSRKVFRRYRIDRSLTPVYRRIVLSWRPSTDICKATSLRSLGMWCPIVIEVWYDFRIVLKKINAPTNVRPSFFFVGWPSVLQIAVIDLYTLGGWHHNTIGLHWLHLDRKSTVVILQLSLTRLTAKPVLYTSAGYTGFYSNRTIQCKEKVWLKWSLRDEDPTWTVNCPHGITHDWLGVSL